MTDDQAMDAIATMLGSASEWRSPADYLEDIANIVAATGRPHPGEPASVAYYGGEDA